MATEFANHNEVHAVLARLSALVSQQDLRVLGEFAEDALVIGSEQGEVAEGQQELRLLLQRVFAQPTRLSWEWDRIRASSLGELCWFFAEGHVVVASADSSEHFPYRLSGVLQRRQGRWLWLQLHGSEPAKA